MDDGLKQRLVGAVVLTAVAVLFLPTVFDSASQSRVDTRSRIPPMPTVPAEPIPEPKPVENIVPAKDPEQMFVPDETKNELEFKADSLHNEQGLPHAWVVQVASFRELPRAEKLRDRLLKLNHKAYLQTVNTDNGKVSRVFVGPKLSHDEALKVKQALDKKLKINAMVLRFKP